MKHQLLKFGIFLQLKHCSAQLALLPISVSAGHTISNLALIAGTLQCSSLSIVVFVDR